VLHPLFLALPLFGMFLCFVGLYGVLYSCPLVLSLSFFRRAPTLQSSCLQCKHQYTLSRKPTTMREYIYIQRHLRVDLCLCVSSSLLKRTYFTCKSHSDGPMCSKPSVSTSRIPPKASEPTPKLLSRSNARWCACEGSIYIYCAYDPL